MSGFRPRKTVRRFRRFFWTTPGRDAFSAKFRGAALKTFMNGYRQTARGTHADDAHPLVHNAYA